MRLRQKFPKKTGNLPRLFFAARGRCQKHVKMTKKHSAIRQYYGIAFWENKI